MRQSDLHTSLLYPSKDIKNDGRPIRAECTQDDMDGFYGEIKPVLIGLALTGRIRYLGCNEGKREFKLISLWTLYYVLVNVLQSIVFGELVYSCIIALTSEDANFITYTNNGIVLTRILLLYAITPLCFLAEKEVLENLMNEWPNFIRICSWCSHGRRKRCLATVLPGPNRCFKETLDKKKGKWVFFQTKRRELWGFLAQVKRDFSDSKIDSAHQYFGYFTALQRAVELIEYFDMGLTTTIEYLMSMGCEGEENQATLSQFFTGFPSTFALLGIFWRQVNDTIGVNFKPHYQRYIKIHAFAVPLLSTVLIVGERNLLLGGNIIPVLPYITLVSGCHYHVLFWFYGFQELRNLAALLENELIKITQMAPFCMKTASELEKLRRLWLQLSIMVQRTGNAMSMSIGCMSVCLITLFIVSWFSLISSILIEDYRNRVDYFFIALATGLIIIVISEPAHRVTEAVGDRIAQQLCCIDLNQVCSEAVSRIQSFSNTIILNSPNVSLGGLAIINRAWLSSMVANVITYLMVLVQLQTSGLRNKAVIA